MAAYRFLCCVLTIFLALCSGCASLAIGDVTATQENVSIQISNAGEPVEAGVQVTVYPIQGLGQDNPSTVAGVPATLRQGENIVTVPVRLDRGTYKLYVYVTINNERQTATIKDIVI